MDIVKYSLRLDGLRGVLMEDERYSYRDVAFNKPNDIVDMMNDLFDMNRFAEEHMYCIAMTAKCKIIGVVLVGKGSINRTNVSPISIFAPTLMLGAGYFVLVHNHPSGDVMPSQDDLLLTERISVGADILGLEFLDHIIIGGENYHSLSENGQMKGE